MGSRLARCSALLAIWAKWLCGSSNTLLHSLKAGNWHSPKNPTLFADVLPPKSCNSGNDLRGSAEAHLESIKWQTDAAIAAYRGGTPALLDPPEVASAQQSLDDQTCSEASASEASQDPTKQTVSEYSHSFQRHAEAYRQRRDLKGLGTDIMPAIARLRSDKRFLTSLSQLSSFRCGCHV